MVELLLGLSILLSGVAVVLLLFQGRAAQDGGRILAQLTVLENNLARQERLLSEEMSKGRAEAAANARQVREELNNSLKLFNDSVLARMAEIAGLQKNQLEVFTAQLTKLTQANEERLDRLIKTNEEKLEGIRVTVEHKMESMQVAVEAKLQTLQADNAVKLEQMRATVDEKLHATLERRLGESFKLVSERLELVHKGLGEMQTLAAGVGDLKKVLTNVKTRGTWGEVQLGNLLEQVLTPEQYAANVVTKPGSNERVEFAIRLPAKDQAGSVLWLPIDAKFPLEDYQRLSEAQDRCDLPAIEEQGKALETRIKTEAKTIREKYIEPPYTTDFGILFLPVEGLYAEVLRRPGLCETLQRDFRVVLAGPATLAAFLNSLQMGFRTLAIEKRSSEVWALLGAVKGEFGKFGDVLEKTQRKLQEASNSIDTAAKRSRSIEHKLKDVQALPAEESELPGAS